MSNKATALTKNATDKEPYMSDLPDHITAVLNEYRGKDGQRTTDVQALTEPILTEIITAIFKLFHGNPIFHEQDTWPLAWRNGHSPYERALDAINKEFGIEFDIEWKKGDVPRGDRVELITIRGSAA